MPDEIRTRRRIAPWPHPHGITDAFGSTIEVSHYQIAGSPRVAIEISGDEISNVHLTLEQAQELWLSLAEHMVASKGASVAIVPIVDVAKGEWV